MSAARSIFALSILLVALAPAARAQDCTAPVGSKKVGKQLLPQCDGGRIVTSGQCCACTGSTVKVPTTLNPTHVPGKCQEASTVCGTNRVIALGRSGGNVCQECGSNEVANADNTACEVCPAGTHKVVEGEDNASCVCDDGKIPSLNDASCLACPTGTVYSAGTCACDGNSVASESADVCAFVAATGVQLDCDADGAVGASDPDCLLH